MPAARRAVGAALLVAAYAPLHRLLAPARTGPAGLSTRATAEAAWSLGLVGTLLILGVAVLGSRLVGGERLTRVLRTAARVLAAPSSAAFAVGIGLTATSLALGTAILVHGGAPTSVDEMAQLLHARAVAEGSLASPLIGPGQAWIVQNGIVTVRGWASIYPPFHTLLLAAGILIGAPWIVGPASVGIATAATTLSCERLMSVPAGRVTGILLALSPFWLLLGGTHLSHATAAACLALVLLTGVRATEGSFGWSVAAGAAVGAAVCTRPWVGLVGSAAILAALWLPRSARSLVAARAHAGRAVALTTGGAPFALLLFWWNESLFGGPLRFGYAAAFGPAHGLGLHADPWGNAYGAVEALAYTGADLVQLGAHLFESPLPAIAVIGAGLLIWPSRGVPGALLWWGVATVAANAAYWHHGVHMGPRMLYESTPAWVALFVAAAAAIASESSSAGRDRGIGVWTVVTLLVGSALLAPYAFAARVGQDLSAATTLPSTPVPSGPSLVFVHGSWSSRVAARLAAAGMRRDSIETALRRNDICAVDGYARWRTSSSNESYDEPPLDMDPLPGSPAELESRSLSEGNLVRVAPDRRHGDACVREARADRFGTIELELLIWRYPPFETRSVMVARDFGPAANELVRSALPRSSYVLIEGLSGSPRLVEYEEGMELLWGGAAGETGR